MLCVKHANLVVMGWGKIPGFFEDTDMFSTNWLTGLKDVSLTSTTRFDVMTFDHAAPRVVMRYRA
jgi:hypothetical protein